MEGEVLRDDQWERVKPFVPGGGKGKRGPRSDGRRFFDALLWRARSGRGGVICRRSSDHIRLSNGGTIAGSRWVCSTACLKLSRPNLILSGS